MMIFLTWFFLWILCSCSCLSIMYFTQSIPVVLLVAVGALFSFLGTLAHRWLQKRRIEKKVHQFKWPSEALPSVDYFFCKSIKRFAIGLFTMLTICYGTGDKTFSTIAIILCFVASILWYAMDRSTKDETEKMEEAVAVFVEKNSRKDQ